MRHVKSIITISLATTAVFAALAFAVYVAAYGNLALAGSSNQVVNAIVSVPVYCGNTLSNTIIGFGATNNPPGIAPGSSVNTANLSVYTNTYGNMNANVFVMGSTWAYSTYTFGVSNTLWSAAKQGGYSGTALTSSFVLAANAVSQGTNTIYFGVAVPAGQQAGNYLQQITVQAKCGGSTYTAPNTVISAYVNVTGYCAVSLGTNAINFGTITPGSNSVYTSNVITDTNTGGNKDASIWVYGGNWIAGGNNFYVANTAWASSNVVYGTGTALTLIGANTGILAGAQGTSYNTNSVYWGLAVPGGQPVGSYTQNIIIINTC